MKKTILLTAAACAMLASGAFAAQSVPANGKLVFDVYRKGKDIGDYVITFTENGAKLVVNSKTRVKVKVPLLGISLYVFEQTSREDWNGGKLAGVKSVTNDNGDKHDITLGASPLMPGSLWNVGTVHASTLLNTIDGKTMRVSVARVGAESVATAKGKVTATHYKVSGGLDRDLWYNDQGVLVHVAFAGDDGSRVDYVMR